MADPSATVTLRPWMRWWMSLLAGGLLGMVTMGFEALAVSVAITEADLDGREALSQLAEAILRFDPGALVATGIGLILPLLGVTPLLLCGMTWLPLVWPVLAAAAIGLLGLAGVLIGVRTAVGSEA